MTTPRSRRPRSFRTPQPHRGPCRRPRDSPRSTLTSRGQSKRSPPPMPSFVAPIVSDDDPEMWDVTIVPGPRRPASASPRTAVAARMFEPRPPAAGAGLRYAALGGLAAIVAAVAGTAYAVRETHAFTGLSFTRRGRPSARASRARSRSS